jgi:hypothetical protein
MTEMTYFLMTDEVCPSTSSTWFRRWNSYILFIAMLLMYCRYWMAGSDVSRAAAIKKNGSTSVLRYFLINNTQKTDRNPSSLLSTQQAATVSACFNLHRQSTSSPGPLSAPIYRTFLNPSRRAFDLIAVIG